jgi:hypothetical protein
VVTDVAIDLFRRRQRLDAAVGVDPCGCVCCRAEIGELEKVDGVSGPLAQRIYDYFRRG